MIYINAPFYHDKSNGISVTYELLRILNRSGLAARILCTEDERYDVSIPEDLKPYYISKAGTPQKVGDDDIVFYLDTAGGNSIHARHVVYWLLNKPGVLTGEEIHFQPEDILAAFSTLVHHKLPQLFLLKDERKLFSGLRSACRRRNDTVSVYFGKVNVQLVLDRNPRLKELIRQYDRVNVITRLSPSERKETLQSIAQSDLLISYDPLSNVNYEATLLGTPVLLMDDAYGLADITYNVGNYGYAFSEEGLSEARREVDQAFEAYCRYLENQEALVVASVQQIINQALRVQSNPEALEANKLVNRMAAKDFVAFYEKQKTPFKNIDFPNDIPLSTRRIIPWARRESTPVDAAVDAETADAESADVESADAEPAADTATPKEKVSLQRRIYAMLKPRWVDDMYKRLPGNLKLYELVFLMFRRMFVCWKE